MICTCSQCSASDYDTPRKREDYMPAPHEILTPEESKARLMATLQAIEASMKRPVRYSDALTEYQRRQKQSLGEWLAENMSEHRALDPQQVINESVK